MTESNDIRANPLLEIGNVGFCAEFPSGKQK